MQTIQRIEVPPRLTVMVTLAGLLERLERSADRVHPAQYRSVVDRLSEVLRTLEPDEAFHQLLGVFPAAAELYENLHYAHAGLCRAPLDEALEAELALRCVLARVGSTPDALGGT